VAALLQAIGPSRLQAIEDTLQDVVERMLEASTHSVDVEKIKTRARQHGLEIESFADLARCNLQILDRCNREHIRFHEWTATVVGGVSGLGGLPAATADLAAVLLSIFHMLQEIAFCYGFDPNDRLEKEIMLRVLLAGVGGSVMKSKALKDIEMLREATDEHAQPDAARLSVVSSKALAEYVEHLAIVLVARLIPRSVPIIAVAIAAHNNQELVEQTGKTALMVYRKRFIERKKEL
jgi:hypothetical protein